MIRCLSVGGFSLVARGWRWFDKVNLVFVCTLNPPESSSTCIFWWNIWLSVAVWGINTFARCESDICGSWGPAWPAVHDHLPLHLIHHCLCFGVHVSWWRGGWSRVRVCFYNWVELQTKQCSCDTETRTGSHHCFIPLYDGLVPFLKLPDDPGAPCNDCLLACFVSLMFKFYLLYYILQQK